MLADMDYTYWQEPLYREEYFCQESSLPFDNTYYIVRNDADMLGFFLERKLVVNSNLTPENLIKVSNNSDISNRVNAILENSSMNKTLASKILGVSRPTLYSWMNNEISTLRTSNIEKIEWLEEFIAELPEDLVTRIGLYKNREIGQNSESLEDIMVKSDMTAKKAAKELINALNRSNNRPSLGSWKKEKTLGKIDQIPEAYSDNG